MSEHSSSKKNNKNTLGHEKWACLVSVICFVAFIASQDEFKFMYLGFLAIVYSAIDMVVLMFFVFNNYDNPSVIGKYMGKLPKTLLFAFVATLCLEVILIYQYIDIDLISAIRQLAN